MPQKYAACIDCGKPKDKPNYNPRCRSCSKRTLPIYTECIDCGEPKTTKTTQKSQRCDSCSRRAQRKDGNFYDHCVDCGAPKSRNYYPRCKPCSKKLLWQDPEFQEKQAAYRDDPGFIKKQRDSHVEIWADKEKRNLQRQTQLEVWSNPELRERHSQILQASYAEKYSDPKEHAAICARLNDYREENWASEDYRESLRQKMLRAWEDENYRQAISDMAVQMWTNDEYRTKRRQTWIDRYGAYERDYPVEFDHELKELIRDRDDRKCQTCGIEEEYLDRLLDVHHIDYDKDNLDPKNLISLCRSCHGKTNGNRNYWQQVFTKYRGRSLKQDWQMQVVVM